MAHSAPQILSLVERGDDSQNSLLEALGYPTPSKRVVWTVGSGFAYCSAQSFKPGDAHDDRRGLS